MTFQWESGGILCDYYPGVQLYLSSQRETLHVNAAVNCRSLWSSVKALEGDPAGNWMDVSKISLVWSLSSDMDSPPPSFPSPLLSTELVLLTRLKNSNIQPLLNVEFQTPKGRNTDLNKAVNKVNLKIGNIFTGLNFQCNKTRAARRSPRSGESDNRCTAVVGGKWSLLCFIPPHPPLYKGRWNYFPVTPLQKQTWSLKVISFVCFWETLVLTPKGKGRCFVNDLNFYPESFYSITWGGRAALLFTYIFHLFVLILKNLQKQIAVFSHQLQLEPCHGWDSVTVLQTPLLSETCAMCSSLFHSCLNGTLLLVTLFQHLHQGTRSEY